MNMAKDAEDGMELRISKCAIVCYELRWEFIKENKKTRFRPRKQKEKKKENAFDQESDQEKKKK